MRYSKILPIAEQIKAQLAPFCSKIEIAGSVRRKKQECGDIEIVLLRDTKRLFEFVDVVNDWYAVKGLATGRYTQRVVTINDEGYTLDLFMPTKEDFYRQFAIRTGSAEYSENIIAHSWVKKGWRGTENGLRLEAECKNKSGKWQCFVNPATKPPIWESEQEFFEWLGVKYLKPEDRK